MTTRRASAQAAPEPPASHFTLFQPGFRTGLLLQTGGEFGFAALVVQFAVAEFLFRLRQLRVQFLHLFFQTGNLFTQGLCQGAQFRFTTLLVFTCLGAVNALFRRFVALIFLFLDIAQPLLIILQIAVKRLDFLSCTR